MVVVVGATVVVGVDVVDVVVVDVVVVDEVVVVGNVVVVGCWQRSGTVTSQLPTPPSAPPYRVRKVTVFAASVRSLSSWMGKPESW